VINLMIYPDASRRIAFTGGEDGAWSGATPGYKMRRATGAIQ